MTVIEILGRMINSRIQIGQLLIDKRSLRIERFLSAFCVSNRSVFIGFITDGLQNPKFILEFLTTLGNILFKLCVQCFQTPFTRFACGLSLTSNVDVGLLQSVSNFNCQQFNVLLRFCFKT